MRLKAQEKKVDHMERAKRLEEIPLLKEQHEDLKAERKQVLARDRIHKDVKASQWARRLFDPRGRSWVSFP